MSTARFRVCLAALSFLVWPGCGIEDVGTVGESTAQAAADAGGAGSGAASGGRGVAGSTGADDEDEDEPEEPDEGESDDDAPEDEDCTTLELQRLNVPFPSALCAACDAATPCMDGLQCIDARCSQCEENDECGDDGHCDHGVCIPEDVEDAEEAEP